MKPIIKVKKPRFFSKYYLITVIYYIRLLKYLYFFVFFIIMYKVSTYGHGLRESLVAGIVSSIIMNAYLTLLMGIAGFIKAITIYIKDYMIYEKYKNNNN